MLDRQFEKLMDCATLLAKDSKYFDKLNVLDINDKCHMTVKIDDYSWPYVKDGVSIKTVNFISSIFTDLTHLFNLASVSKYTADDLEKKFQSQLVFNYRKGCLLISANLSGILDLMFDGYKDLLNSNATKWHCAISGSLFAFSIAMLGTKDWYSLEKLNALKYANRDNDNLTKALAYAQKILIGSRDTPDFLSKNLSEKGRVSINGEDSKTAAQLREFKYKETLIDRYIIDDEFSLEGFSPNTVRIQAGNKKLTLSLKELNDIDRDRMSVLAKKVVQSKKSVRQSLQVSVRFKGVEYIDAQVDAFGQKREGVISADELFNNPLYSLPKETKTFRKIKKTKQSDIDMSLLEFGESYEKKDD